jgi:hypothetical protein
MLLFAVAVERRQAQKDISSDEKADPEHCCCGD